MLKNIPLPNNPSAMQWNAAVNTINIQSTASYGLVDDALDKIEIQKDVIKEIIGELERNKTRARIYLDYLAELNRRYVKA